ncbi:MAG: hypothetical protein HS115_18385 [Spirochaetales bacterium]|nr:hypothetical protein [Spirochaetales bacterium]
MRLLLPSTVFLILVWLCSCKKAPSTPATGAGPQPTEPGLPLSVRELTAARWGPEDFGFGYYMDFRAYIDGLPVVTMGFARWGTTTAVKFRSAPDSLASEYKCTYGDINPQEYDHIPVGKEVKVLARTVEKAPVQGWLNYWYYVIPEDDWYAGGCEPRRGWVYGEFLGGRP